MRDVSQGPAKQTDRDGLERRVRADLWKAVWEASNVLSYAEIRAVVKGTLAEIKADEP